MNNKEINDNNKDVNNITDQLNGEFQSCKVNVLNYDVENRDIRNDGVHPNLDGIQNGSDSEKSIENDWLQLFNKRCL